MKTYGSSKIEKCYFCEKNSTLYNNQGIPICSGHRMKELTDVVCACGMQLDNIQKGKWGPFFVCPNCGPLSLRKIKEIIDIPTHATYKVNGALKHQQI